MTDFVKVRTNSENKLNVLFGLYDAKLVVKNTGYYLNIGAGSLNALPIIKELSTNVKFDGLIASIGRYCDFNRSTKLVFAGEHYSNLVIGFTGSPLLKQTLGKFGLKSFSAPKSITHIGHQCVFSTNSTVLSGSVIANHTIVGAGALVTSKHNVGGKLIGVPATLRSNSQEGSNIDLFKFHPTTLFRNIQSANPNSDLNKILKVTKTDKVFSEVIVFEIVYGQGKLLDIELVGLEKNDKFKARSELSKRTQISIEQMGQPSSDIEVDLNLFRDF